MYDALAVSQACYLEHAVSVEQFLRNKGHRFTSVLVSSALSTDLEGHYIIAERISGNDKVTILGIRGSYCKADWETNFKVWPSFSDHGWVHSGWYSRMLHLPQAILQNRLVLGHRIIITGHSLGGGVAQLLAMEMINMNSGAENSVINRIQCITFASPVVKIGAGADNFNNVHKDRFWHFIHSRDIVPKVLTWMQEVIKSVSDVLLNSMFASGSSTLSAIQSIMKCASLLSTSDPTLRMGDWHDMKAHMNSGFVSRTGQLIASAVHYKPVGLFFSVDSDDPFSALSVAEVASIMDYSNIIVTLDMIEYHSLGGTYSHLILHSNQFQESMDRSTYSNTLPGND